MSLAPGSTPGDGDRADGDRADETCASNTLPRTGGDPAAGHDDPLPRGTAIRRYVVLDRIGAGGMGVVYAAYDYALDRRIALKLVRGRSSTTARARLVREAQVLARLSHPNVVAVYDVGEHDGEVYVAMELVEGTSLREWLAREVRDWREIVDAFRKVGAGLAAAHAAGIVHRDVKPDNVLIDRSGAVRVGDFGLARVAPPHADAGEPAAPHARAVTWTGAAIGTPPYMAPEQHAADREIDARADQFGFCVALYEALYETRPFAGDDAAVLCAAIAAGRLAPGAPPREVPAWVRRVVVRGLAADPAARFPSMAALLAELARDPRARRRRWLAAGVALTAVAGLAGGAWHVRGDAAQACRADPARLVGVWDVARQGAIRAAFASSGAPGAADRWARVERAFDERAAGWQAMRREACEATVRAEQSPELLDLRMACLDDRLAELRALSDVLATADRARVEHALDAVRGLEGLDACARGAVLRAGGQRATDPGAGERRQRLARLEALSLIGDRPNALELARALASDAGAVRDREVEGQAQRAVGQLLTARGEVPAAEEALYRAIAAAAAAGADALAARAWLDLAWLVGEEAGRLAEGLRLASIAQGTIDRLGGSPPLQAVLEDRLGVLLHDQGKYAEAAPHLERGLALREQLFGPASTQAAASLQHLAILRAAEGEKPVALDLHRRARENAERALGPTHPEVLMYLGGEGAALFELRRYDEALALFQRALAAVLAHDPDDAADAAGLLANIAMVQRKHGELPAARASLERAVALYERISGPHSQPLAVALSNLALVLADLGQHDAALAQLDRALAIQERALGKDHPDVADTLSTVASVLLLAKRPGSAIAPLERAIAIRAPVAGAAQSVAEDRLQLARALVASRGDRRRAFELADLARAAFATADDAESVQGVDAWRAEVGQRASR